MEATANSILLEVVTPDRLLLSQDVQMVMAVGTDGAMGILPGHAHLLTGLKISALRWMVGDKEECAAIAGGFMEVNPKKVSVLVEAGELPDEIDANRCQLAQKRAEDRLEKAKDGAPDIDVARAERALQRAITRLKVMR